MSACEFDHPHPGHPCGHRLPEPREIPAGARLTDLPPGVYTVRETLLLDEVGVVRGTARTAVP